MNKGQISVKLEQNNTYFPIEAEEEYEWFAIRFTYEKEKSWGRLHLFDSEKHIRFCFLDGGNERLIVVHNQPELTSSIAVPGPIMTGTWMLEVSNEEGRTFEAEWEFGCGTLPDEYVSAQIQGEREYWNSGKLNAGFIMENYDWAKIWQAGSRWYKGDFHTHTVLSDGKMTQLMNREQALKQGMDFFVATDHNVMSTSWAKGDALVIPGVEVTAGDGHWNALGLRKWIDWRATSPDGGLTTQQGMDRLMKEAAELGAICSINHPMLTPWAWLYGETQLEGVHSMEIWNDPTFSPNNVATEKALQLWTVSWNEGYRITGIGGSDSHMLPTESYDDSPIPSLIGDPATYVWCDDLSADAVLEGVRNGHVYVSRGPVIDASIQAGGNTYRFGCDLSAAFSQEQGEIASHEVTCTLSVASDVNARVTLIHNGIAESVRDVSITATGEVPEVLEWNIALEEGTYNWYRFDIRDEAGTLLAFTNPVYYGSKKPQITTYNELLASANLT
ncbi:CehA/McbA family metallohydrolase [Paenibacillus sp. FSL F4-0236]|uniref:CehA/McbA family metallohydrolase n=1 Tax=Paenibacillus sp. FSL F4-0236 TaxID=2954731 RepID=UPI0030F81D85